MSKDFELLRKLEPGSNGTSDVPRHQLYPGSHPRTEIAELQPSLVSGTRDPDWLKALTVLRKRWRVAVVFALIMVTVAALVAFLIRPEYQPLARLEIDPPGSETFTMQANGTPLSETQYLKTQEQN